MTKWIVGLTLTLSLAVPAGASAAEDGAALWKANCTKCHGATGNGDTKVGKKLKVADYTTAEWQAKAKDEELTKAIADGKGEKGEDGETPMPSFKAKLNPEQIKALVAHMRTFKPGAAAPAK